MSKLVRHLAPPSALMRVPQRRLRVKILRPGWVACLCCLFLRLGLSRSLSLSCSLSFSVSVVSVSVSVCWPCWDLYSAK